MKNLLLIILLATITAGQTFSQPLASLPVGQVLQRSDTSAILLPQNSLPPGIPNVYQLQQFGLMVTVMNTRPNAAILQVRALIETSDGIRRWYRTEAPYDIGTSGSVWVPVFFNTGKQQVTAVYGLRITVIDAGQEQRF